MRFIIFAPHRGCDAVTHPAAIASTPTVTAAAAAPVDDTDAAGAGDEPSFCAELCGACDGPTLYEVGDANNRMAALGGVEYDCWMGAVMIYSQLDVASVRVSIVLLALLTCNKSHVRSCPDNQIVRLTNR
jgi:hypothetical protein